MQTRCAGFSKTGARYRVPGIGYRLSGTWDLVPGTGAGPTPGAEHRAPKTEPGYRKTRTSGMQDRNGSDSNYLVPGPRDVDACRIHGSPALGPVGESLRRIAMRWLLIVAGLGGALLPEMARTAELNGSWTCTPRPRTPAVVYAQPVPPRSFSPPETPAVIDQRGLQFQPSVLPVLVGTRVQFPNHDLVLHNVFSASPVKLFNLGTYPPGESRGIVFDRPGVVEVLCHLHPEMRAYVVVLETPYFAVTDRRGFFQIREIPAGTYEVRWWSETCGSGTAGTVTLGEADVGSLRLVATPQAP